jgi:hypothetical protein
LTPNAVDGHWKMKPKIRKLIVQLEETSIENGRKVSPATRKVAIAVVIRNPYAGKYVKDLAALYDLGAALSPILARRGLAALGAKPGEIDSYGKGAIVGAKGELEHAAALIHPQFGAPVRAAIGGGAAIIPSTKKVGGPGATIIVPLTDRNDIWKFDNMDALEISIPDAPREDEMVVVLAFGIGGRPLKRTKLKS